MNRYLNNWNERLVVWNRKQIGRVPLKQLIR